MLNRDFLTWNSILVSRFCTLNQDFTLNRDSLNRDFTVPCALSLVDVSLCECVSVRRKTELREKVGFLFRFFAAPMQTPSQRKKKDTFWPRSHLDDENADGILKKVFPSFGRRGKNRTKKKNLSCQIERREIFCLSFFRFLPFHSLSFRNS